MAEHPNERQEQAYPLQASPQHAYHQQGYPTQDYLAPDNPQQAYQPQAFLGHGISQHDFSQQTYQPQAYPQHSFSQQSLSQQSVSPRPFSGQSISSQPYPPQAISPQVVSPQLPTDSPRPIQAISQQHAPWLDPSSPDLRDSSGFDRTRDNHRSLMSNDLIDVSSPKTLDVAVVRRSPTAALPKSGPLLLRILKSKWSMIACLVVGVAGAIGHHVLYNHLNGLEATNQQWWLRLGQLISFIAKANFVVAVMMAHQQVAWRAVGQKGFSIEAVDSLFGSAHNITELFNREAWIKSWFVMFLALYMWLSPFVVIFTSATLDVVPGDKVENTLCPSVRTLNFSNEAKKSFQTPKKAPGETMTGRSLSFYNWTALDGNLAKGADDNDNIFEYYNVPSPPLERIVSGVFSSGQPIQKKNVSEEICGRGWDCSTTVHFVGPGYNCKELAKGVGSQMQRFGDAKSPFNLSQLVPVSSYTYLASTDLGEYMRPQMDNVSEGGIPSKKDGPPFPKNLGVFRTEPMIWIGYATVENYTKAHAMNNQTDGWNDDYTPIIFACEHWEVNYTVTFNYTAGLQTYNVTNRDYKRKIIDTTWSNWTNESTDGTADGNTAEPETNYVSPRKDYARYRRIAAYHSLGLKLRNQLFGYVKVEGSAKADGAITASTLLDRHESLAVPDFQQEVRRTYENLLISLLSDPQLLAVAWAADPSKLSGTGIGGDDTKYACERRRTANFFDYEWPALAAVYAVSFIIATIGVYYGIAAMSSDGTYTQREMTFSTIAGATKRVSVDENEKRETKIRCFPVEERSGDRVYEFRAELQG
ncbi:hypothetical protein B0T10DRAFT_569276 [Thelonectria olida]|uniref:Uncharacterized protein n=1 Tax=Thelonectria olida TaxID=1576542 RepID=A0A9P8VR61_9HYPO|nr:hypothetical protein B0T10DRAFT_569276 [Thelonectria olida]